MRGTLVSAAWKHFRMREIRRPMVVDACASTPLVITARSILFYEPSFLPLPSHCVVVFPAGIPRCFKTLPLHCAARRRSDGTGKIKSPDAGHSGGGAMREKGGEGEKKRCSRAHVAIIGVGAR